MDVGRDGRCVEEVLKCGGCSFIEDGDGSSMSSSIDDAYVDTTLSALLDSRCVISPPLVVLFGDFVRLRIVDFLRLMTWFSRELVELRKKFATRCGILKDLS